MQDAELQAAITPELYAGERLRWAGKPAPRYVLRQHFDDIATMLLLIVAVSGFLFVFFVFGLRDISIAAFRIPLFALVLLPVVVLVCFIAYYYRQAARTYYAVTNQRDLIIKPTLDGKSVLAYNVIPYIERRTRANGKDDLIFASETYTPVMYSNFTRNSTGSYYYRIRKIGFFGIENAREVESRIVRTFSRQPAPA